MAKDRTTMFCSAIETLVTEQDMSYFDALIQYSEINSLEPEVVGTLVTKAPTIKAKLEVEAEGLNLLPKTARLDL